MYWCIFKFRALSYMCPDSSVGSTLYIFPLILVDQRGREFKSTLRNNFFWPFFSASNYIIFYNYVICMLYPTRIRSQKVWVVYVYYRFILEQCGLNRHHFNIIIWPQNFLQAFVCVCCGFGMYIVWNVMCSWALTRKPVKCGL